MVFLKSDNELLDDGAYRESLMLPQHEPVCYDQPVGVVKQGGEQLAEPVPRGVLIIRDFIDAEQCARIRRFADESTSERLKVMYRDASGVERHRPDEGRVTERVDISSIHGEIAALLGRVCREVVMPHYGIEVEWYEHPSLLKYGAGGKYEHHSDNENWDGQQKRWTRFCDRAYSVLLYINDDFEGGGLYFRNFDYRIKPGTGMLVAFPSDHRYVHRAEPVDSGTRYAIVSWIVERGKRYFTRGKPLPPHAIPLD